MHQMVYSNVYTNICEGRSCYVPRWQHDTMEMVLLTSIEDFRALPVNRWNIPEPRHDEPRENGNYHIHA
jgi:5-formyltetrahydrofolate cyclo-ligase